MKDVTRMYCRNDGSGRCHIRTGDVESAEDIRKDKLINSSIVELSPMVDASGQTMWRFTAPMEYMMAMLGIDDDDDDSDLMESELGG